MALLAPGFWQNTYWVDSYWDDDYWSDYGVAAPIIIPSTRITFVFDNARKILSMDNDRRVFVFDNARKIYEV